MNFQLIENYLVTTIPFPSLAGNKKESACPPRGGGAGTAGYGPKADPDQRGNSARTNPDRHESTGASMSCP